MSRKVFELDSFIYIEFVKYTFLFDWAIQGVEFLCKLLILPTLSILKNPWWVKTWSSLATAAPETVWVTLGLVGVKITVSASNKFYPESCLVSQQVLTVGFEKENCTDKKCGCHAQSWYFSLALI